MQVKTALGRPFGQGPFGEIVKRISDITKRDILDYLMINKVNWSGNLDETAFLSRIFDLTSMPSTDSRFDNFEGDIWQHRYNNFDWDDYWPFSDGRTNLLHGDDAIYLQFLCEMLHPVVRSNYEETTQLVQAFNSYLRPDGYELVEKARISGHPIFAARHREQKLSFSKSREIQHKLSSEYVMQQITAMETAIESSPHVAIGIAKELIETALKSIKKESGDVVGNDLTLPQLMKDVSKILNLVPKDVPEEKKGADKIRLILGNLSSIVSGIAELRNDYGSGHGRDGEFKGLQPRHAKLAVGAATTLTVFLLETWELTEKTLEKKRDDNP